MSNIKEQKKVMAVIAIAAAAGLAFMISIDTSSTSQSAAQEPVAVVQPAPQKPAAGVMADTVDNLNASDKFDYLNGGEFASSVGFWAYHAKTHEYLFDFNDGSNCGSVVQVAEKTFETLENYDSLYAMSANPPRVFDNAIAARRHIAARCVVLAAASKS